MASLLIKEKKIMIINQEIILNRIKHFFFLVDQQFSHFNLLKWGHMVAGKVTSNGGKFIDSKTGKEVPMIDLGYYSLDDSIIYKIDNDLYYEETRLKYKKESVNNAE